MKTIFAATALSLGLAGASFATDTIRASDPDGILEWIKDEGFVAKAETDSVGDPKLEIRYYGTSFSIYFYGCTDNRKCEAIQFFSGYKTDDISLEQLNNWNSNFRNSRAYMSDVGSVRVENDIYLGRDGLTAHDFEDVFESWLSTREEFEKYIDW